MTIKIKFPNFHHCIDVLCYLFMNYWWVLVMEFLTFSQKLLFWRHDVEVRVLSRDSGDYLKVLVGNIYHSTSVSLRFTCFNFISYILCFILFTSSPRSGATALDGEYVSTDFLATSKEWFFSGFSYLAWHTYFAFHAYYVYVYRCKTV